VSPRSEITPARPWTALPVLTTLLAGLAALEPVPLPGYAVLTPAFLLMAVYHWTVYQPELLPPVALFAIGIGYDLLCGASPGTTPLLLLSTRVIVLHVRRWFINRSFAFIWASFAALTAAAAFAVWALDCVLAGRFFDISDNAFRAALTVALFPLASFVLGRAQQARMGSD
jgi:rod shape-determining protein MreD